MVVISTSNTDIYRLDAGYYVHIYSTIGTKNIEITEGGNVDVLVVAGGGSGGLATTAFAAGGGGGGGEVAYVTSFPVTVGTMSITVGAGGSNSNGGNSIFGSIQTNGGGQGGSTGATANTGGSGGGAGRNVLTAATSVKLYASGLGNAGGIGLSTISGAAGGGGAGGVGGNVLNGTNGGLGGAGYTTTMSGVSQVYGSGGGGGARGGGDTGGGDGGTNAGKGGGCETTSLTAINGGNAINGFGGGGGGAGGGGNAANTNIGIPGTGGSGIIIVRYPRPPLQSTGVMSLSDLRSAYAFENPSSSEFSLGTLYGWTNVPNTSVLTGVMNLSDYYGKTGGVGVLFNETGLTTTYAETTMPGGTGTTHTLSSVYNYQVSGLAGWSAVRYRSNGTQIQLQSYGNLRTNANLSTKLAKILSYLQAVGRTITLKINYAIIKGTRYSSTELDKSFRIVLTVNGVSTALYENTGSQATITRFFNISPYVVGATSFAINLRFNLASDLGSNILDSNRLEINSVLIDVY